MAKKAANTQLVHIRMTKDMHRKIQRDADRHGQTINAEILSRLEAIPSDRMFEDCSRLTMQNSCACWAWQPFWRAPGRRTT